MLFGNQVVQTMTKEYYLEIYNERRKATANMGLAKVGL